MLVDTRLRCKEHLEVLRARYEWTVDIWRCESARFYEEIKRVFIPFIQYISLLFNINL